MDDKYFYKVFLKVETGLESFATVIAYFFDEHAAHDYVAYLSETQDDLFVSYYVEDINNEKK